MTLGHVILATDAATLNAFRRHERVHVLQFERWGFCFPVVYLAASLVAIARGRSAWRGNCFEQEALAAERPDDLPG